MRTLLLSLLLIFSLPLQAQGLSSNNAGFDFGNNEPEFLPVEQAYQLAVEPQSDGSIRLYWQAADGYYLYQHAFRFELRDSDGEIATSAELPPALERYDDFFGDVKVYYQQADITLVPERSTATATLTVTSQGCADAGLCYPPQRQQFALNFSAGTATEIPVGAIANSSNPGVEGNSSAADSQPALLGILLLAFLGGMILNLMPCVFPILSLKVLSFANSSEASRHSHSWWYTAGVIVSFLAVAALLIALQSAGRAVGWGFQLQSPGFVIALAYLFIAMGLSLSGLVLFGGSIANLGSGLANRQGHSGDFFTGVLAVVVASPCTAPFMGTALGFALTQPPAVALTVFTALGAGMASPMLALSYSSWLRRAMPKPGAWMETLKQFLAFPLYGSAIWLLWVAGRQIGVNGMAVALVGALLLALGLWLWRFGLWQRLLAAACVIFAVAGPLLSSGSHQAITSNEKTGNAWSEEKVAELRNRGQAVFVDFTADWCITCLANEQTVLHTDDVAEAFAKHDVAYLVADWTSYDPVIAKFLERHGRSGIPFYLVYPPNSQAQPLILPQLLTKQIVIEAIEQSTRNL